MSRALIPMRSPRGAWAAVACRSGPPGPGRGVRGKVGLTGELSDRDDVTNDGPGCLAADHVANDGLHGEVRAAQVHGDVCVEQLGRRVEECAAGGQPDRVHTRQSMRPNSATAACTAAWA